MFINRKKKLVNTYENILLVSSQGGHWIQLKRLTKAFNGHQINYLSVAEIPPVFNNNNGEKYFSVTDATRNYKYKLVKQFFQVAKVVRIVRPKLIVTTGSSVGLMSLIWGRLFGSKTVWIDSIANYEKLSMSGKLAKPFATHHLTQWPHLQRGKTKYFGSVI